MNPPHSVQAKPRRRSAARLPRERRVADIMAAARDVFTERGYQDALIADIAARAGVVEGTIYRYFANKRDLLVRVIEEWYGAMLARNADLATIGGTRARLHALVRRHLAAIRAEPALSRLMFMEIRPDPGYRATRLYDLNRLYTREVAEIVRHAVATGEFATDVPPALVRDMIFGCIEHHTWAFLRGEGDFSVDAAADGIVTLVCRGLATAAAATDPGRLAAVVARLEEAAVRVEAAAATLAHPEGRPP